MQIYGTITSPALNTTWTVLFVAYLVWFFLRFRDPAAPRAARPPLVQFGGPWTLFSRRFWETRGLALKKGSLLYLVGGIVGFTILYFVFDLVS